MSRDPQTPNPDWDGVMKARAREPKALPAIERFVLEGKAMDYDERSVLRWATQVDGRLVMDGPRGLWRVMDKCPRALGDALIEAWKSHVKSGGAR